MCEVVILRRRPKKDLKGIGEEVMEMEIGREEGSVKERKSC